MSSPSINPSRSTILAMVGAAMVMAQFVSGKATRDALFLTSVDYTALPTMLIATSAISILLVALNTLTTRRIAPARLVPASFAASGLLFLLEWLVRPAAPALTAVVVYLHISGAGPLLASGFWLVSTEQFDPHTAKQRFGQIAGVGTLGGLLSAIIAERVGATFGAPAMLPCLALLQFGSAFLVWRLAATGERARSEAVPSRPLAHRSGLRAVADAPHLRHLAYVVLLGTTSAALVDYLFKVRATEAFGRGDQLLRFFALYYAATSLLAFVVQMTSSRRVLERFGLAVTASSPSIALALGTLGSLVVPGFGSILLARAGESVFRGSLFRTGYELFYTPIPAEEKRAAKSVIDVAFDRAGDAVGGTLVRLAILLVPAFQVTAILLLGLVGSIGAILAASRLNRAYVHTLATSLIDGAANTGVPGSVASRRTLNMTALRRRRAGAAQADRADVRPAPAPAPVVDPEVTDILRLRSRSREQIMDVLCREDGLSPALVSHVIPLLAWDPVAEHAVFALRKVAEEHVGELIDALIDPNQEFAVRRRLARVFSVCVSQRAADGLIYGLDDVRFDVRFESARSLVEIQSKNPRIILEADRILAVVLREAGVGRPVWESRRLLDGVSANGPLSAVDSFIVNRAGTSLAHVFTLLSLVLAKEPLQIAFRSLYAENARLQGTALEYLDGVLPRPIRDRLWPFLEPQPVARQTRPREELIAELLRSHRSVVLSLENLQRADVGTAS